jgi:hypothetical protein
MPLVGFETMIPVFELTKILHVSNCAATVMGTKWGSIELNRISKIYTGFTVDVLAVLFLI